MTRRAALADMLEGKWIVAYFCPHCRGRVWMDLVWVGVGSCTRCSISLSKSEALCQSWPEGHAIPRWLD